MKELLLEKFDEDGRFIYYHPTAPVKIFDFELEKSECDINICKKLDRIEVAPTENIAEFHIIALNDGKGEMIFQCTNDDGTTDKYILALSISRHQKTYLQIDTVSFREGK